MSIIILENSSAAYEPLAHYKASSTSFTARSHNEMQSSSVTPTGHLWEQVLARMKKDNLPLASFSELSRTAVSPDAKQMQKHLALIQLLKSWQEDDEQEERDTWGHLKRALDEDRLSDRKLFP